MNALGDITKLEKKVASNGKGEQVIRESLMIRW